VETETKASDTQDPVTSVVAEVESAGHTCRTRSYNAMVDTCPGCGEPQADAARAEADKNPLRHVRASRWIVHPLLQYHYLPYWPRNVSQVFATVDIKRNMVVAACVYAYPVLRSHLREGVFGRLTPITLNRDFRQLVRWMVHPDYRNSSVGSDLLQWSFSQVEQPVVEAINRSWVPIDAFLRLGMIERSDGDKHYYYRLKECRKRVDEIKDAPVQAESPEGAILHTYPRIWTPRVQLVDAAFIALIQPYAGALIRTHHWDATSYTAFYDGTTTLQSVEDSAGLVEITDATKREAILRRMSQGLPGTNNN
jgi:hypothetical protein